MPRLRDLTGQRHGALVAIRRVENMPGYGQARWLFRCDCGNEKVLFGYNVFHQGVKSCGCYMKEHPSRLLHGMNGTPEHISWCAMRARCNDSDNPAYHLYGGRGIKICERWKDFESFYADMGKRPDGLTLDRIDNEGPYSPENCQWASRKQQVRNRRTTTFYEWRGYHFSLQEWAEKQGIPYKTIWRRFKDGKRGFDLLLRPVRGSKKGNLSLPSPS